MSDHPSRRSVLRPSLHAASALVVLALLLAAPRAAAQCTYSATYFFGASNLDTGNFLNHPFWGAQPYAPLAANGYWMGRWQAGPSWAEYLAESLGGSTVASSEGGTNYAIGLASTSPHPGETPAMPGSNQHALYLSTQVDQVLADEGGALDPNALYVFEIGHNDVPVQGRTPAEAPTAGEVVVTQMERLRSAGARHFMVRLLGPGLDPYATPFNQAIVDGVGMLRAAGASVVVVDTAAFVAEYLTADHLATIGVTDFGNCRADTPCQAEASAAALLGLQHDHEFLFFDDIPHWSHAVQEEIARHALASLPCALSAVEVPTVSDWGLWLVGFALAAAGALRLARG